MTCRDDDSDSPAWHGPESFRRSARQIDKGFGQIQEMAVAVRPTSTESPHTHGQHLGGQMTYLDPQPDQKPHVIGKKMQTGALALRGPADMTVSRGNLSRGTGPA